MRTRSVVRSTSAVEKIGKSPRCQRCLPYPLPAYYNTRDPWYNAGNRDRFIRVVYFTVGLV